MISFSLIIVQILSSMWIKLKIKSERWYIKMKSNHQLKSLTTNFWQLKLIFSAYTQVITITIYSYLFANLFGHQFLEPRDDAPNLDLATFSHLGVKLSLNGPFANHTPIIYVPIFTIIEFIAYLGWIKVAECLLNPWGDDDEDFQVNYLIDRNFQVLLIFIMCTVFRMCWVLIFQIHIFLKQIWYGLIT